jgi:hypothetical protein
MTRPGTGAAAMLRHGDQQFDINAISDYNAGTQTEAPT